jgi:hypothetical protein
LTGCPTDVLDADGWDLEVVALLERDPHLLAALRGYVELMKAVGED